MDLKLGYFCTIYKFIYGVLVRDAEKLPQCSSTNMVLFIDICNVRLLCENIPVVKSMSIEMYNQTCEEGKVIQLINIKIYVVNKKLRYRCPCIFSSSLFQTST